MSYRTNRRTKKIYPLTGRIRIAHFDARTGREGESCQGMFIDGVCNVCGARGFVKK